MENETKTIDNKATEKQVKAYYALKMRQFARSETMQSCMADIKNASKLGASQVIAGLIFANNQRSSPKEVN